MSPETVKSDLDRIICWDAGQVGMQKMTKHSGQEEISAMKSECTELMHRQHTPSQPSREQTQHPSLTPRSSVIYVATLI